MFRITQMFMKISITNSAAINVMLFPGLKITLRILSRLSAPLIFFHDPAIIT